ncbi:MATE family efflux transporter [Niallia nealsonii]|uniref:Polysaccharide biosynthesis protein n=1 Tax=Niallia nealsonii TaxID=115979 RepID=A0A2N0Z2H6_9BACI|nr:hypothetical protein [Niallia nealsonii]PKG23705.1 hypothetical protein CWS01_10200 [Niallia nealsonii]
MYYHKIIKVVFVDLFSLLSGIFSIFFLPKIMSVEQYSIYRTFGLYIAYSGVFHLGFSDGIYIRYGGKNKNEVNNREIRGYYNRLAIFVTVISIVMLAISFYIEDIILRYFALYILPFNLIHFYKLFYRAIGEFDRYSLLQGIQSVFNFVPLLIFLIISSKGANYLIVMQLVGIIAVSLLLNLYLLKKEKSIIKNNKIEYKVLLGIISTGFTVMIANLCSTVFFSIDRWLIKISFTNADFAYYSFAVSLLSLFSYLIASFTNIAYPFLARAKENEIEDINHKLKNYILMFSFLFINIYYIISAFIEIYIPDYIPSLNYLYILFLTLPFLGVINVVYSNLYKAQKKVKLYLITVVIMLFFSIVLNIIVINIFNTVYSISIATLVSFIIWYLYSSSHFSDLAISIKEISYIILNIVFFIVLNIVDIDKILSTILGLSCSIIFIIIFYKEESYTCFKVFNKKIRVLIAKKGD